MKKLFLFSLGIIAAFCMYAQNGVLYQADDVMLNNAVAKDKSLIDRYVAYEANFDMLMNDAKTDTLINGKRVIPVPRAGVVVAVDDAPRGRGHLHVDANGLVQVDRAAGTRRRDMAVGRGQPGVAIEPTTRAEHLAHRRDGDVVNGRVARGDDGAGAPIGAAVAGDDGACVGAGGGRGAHGR